MNMQKHFVSFLSPGTFVSEETVKPIDSWDVVAATEMAHDIVERHGATPYAFRFSTRERREDELDSKTVARSGLYFLGGRIDTLADVEARNSPDESILRSNMRGNQIAAVVVNDNSWRSTHEFDADAGDVLLDFVPRKNPEPVASEEQ